MTFKSRLIIIDEVPIFEIALKKLFIDSDIAFNIIGRADNGIDGMTLIRTLNPDAIVIDVDIKFVNTFEVIKRAKAINKKVRVIVFGMLKSDHLKHQLVCSGADLCIDSRSSLEACIEAFKLAQSETFSHPKASIRTKLIGAINNPYSLSLLSPRETLVLKQLALGEKNYEIAKRHNLSPKTISTYKYRIAKKLGIQTIFEFRDFARKNKII